MTDIFRASHHPDGEWDCSMSNIDGEELDWEDSITVKTEDGTEITLYQSGRIEVNSSGNLTVKK